MSEVDKIVRLLKDESVEKRIAAAIVLGELRAKGPHAVDGFVSLLDSGVPLLQRHALEALTHVAARRRRAQGDPMLLASNVDDVRRAAAARDSQLRRRGRRRDPRAHGEGSDGRQRRALDAVLADVGGKDAFSTLSSGLATSRRRSRESRRDRGAPAREGRGRTRAQSYLAETEKYPEERTRTRPAAIVGGAEDPRLPRRRQRDAHAPRVRDATQKQPPNVQARSAHRAAVRIAGGKPNAKVVAALVEAAESKDRTLAHTALHTLGTLTLPPSTLPRFEKLLAHEDVERVRFAAAYLASQASATKALVKALVNQDRARAEVVAETLTGREEAAPALARAMLDTKDLDRAWLLKKVLTPIAKSISPALRKELLALAEKRLSQGAKGWEAPLEVVQAADSELVGKAMRALAERLRRSKNDDRAATVLGLVLRTPNATDDDRYTLASIELRKSPLDTRPQTRAADGSLSRLRYLTTRGFDVAGALRKDRALELDHLYYVGFHFSEEGHTLGDDLLEHVVKKGGKSKIAKAAKNKLSLTA